MWDCPRKQSLFWIGASMWDVYMRKPLKTTSFSCRGALARFPATIPRSQALGSSSPCHGLKHDECLYPSGWKAPWRWWPCKFDIMPSDCLYLVTWWMAEIRTFSLSKVLPLYISPKAHSPLFLPEKWLSINGTQWCSRKLAFLDAHPSLYLSPWIPVTPNFGSLVAFTLSVPRALTTYLTCRHSELPQVFESPRQQRLEHSQNQVEEFSLRLWRETVRCTEAQAPFHYYSMREPQDDPGSPSKEDTECKGTSGCSPQTRALHVSLSCDLENAGGLQQIVLWDNLVILDLNNMQWNTAPSSTTSRPHMGVRRHPNNPFHLQSCKSYGRKQHYFLCCEAAVAGKPPGDRDSPPHHMVWCQVGEIYLCVLEEPMSPTCHWVRQSVLCHGPVSVTPWLGDSQ